MSCLTGRTDIATKAAEWIGQDVDIPRGGKLGIVGGIRLAKTLVLILAVALCGCSRIHQHLTSTVWHANGDVEKRVTCCVAYVSGDTKEALDKLRISNGKTHSIGISGMSGESSLDNVATITHDAASILASSLIKAFLPIP